MVKTEHHSLDTALSVPAPRNHPRQMRAALYHPPIRVRARAVFAESLRNAHRWLDELTKDAHQTIEVIAAREHKSDAQSA
jgi:hypothetical protein